VNIQNNYGYTALIYAAVNKSFIDHSSKSPILIDIIKLLIESGADWNIKKAGKDFLDYLDPVMSQEIINRFPIEYKEYFIKKDIMDRSEKYNI